MDIFRHPETSSNIFRHPQKPSDILKHPPPIYTNQLWLKIYKCQDPGIIHFKESGHVLSKQHIPINDYSRLITTLHKRIFIKIIELNLSVHPLVCCFHYKSSFLIFWPTLFSRNLQLYIVFRCFHEKLLTRTLPVNNYFLILYNAHSQ